MKYLFLGMPDFEILIVIDFFWFKVGFVCDVCVKLLSRVWLFANPWIAAHQAPLSMELPRQEY